jgi:hypothetical protein
VARTEENVKCRSDKLTDRDHMGATSIVGSEILRQMLEKNKI